MTTYTGIANSAIDQDSPATQILMQLLRDNPISIAEADATVPNELYPTVVLGIQPLVGASAFVFNNLDLTPYRAIAWACDAMSSTASNWVASIGTVPITGPTLRSNGDSLQVAGFAFLGLSSVGWSVSKPVTIADPAEVAAGQYGPNGATTSITLSMNVGNFDSGTFILYGIK